MADESDSPGPPPRLGPADEDGLVRAILADPWDGLARAAYSDWLEEQGKPLQAALLIHVPTATVTF